MVMRGSVYVPTLSFLLSDAQPTWRALEGEPDPRTRRRRERQRDEARDELIRIYTEAESTGALETLAPSIKELCERWATENEGHLPKRKGGAPRDDHFRLTIHVAAIQALAAIPEPSRTKGFTDRTLRDVAARVGRSYESVRNIFYDPDPDWQRAAAVEWSRVQHDAEAGGVEVPLVDLRPEKIPKRPAVRRRRTRPKAKAP
jgi:hypothetical protein